MTKTLYILGAGGHGKVVADAAKKMKKWEEIYFLDDKLVGQKLLGVLVKDKITNCKRKSLLIKLEEKKCKIATIIHPFSSIGEEVKIGEGTVVFSGVVIKTSTIIGRGCILNTSCFVEHDSKLKNYVHLSPGVNLAGNVNVGECTWIGVGATVVNNTKITTNCTIGAHSLVLKDILQQGIYFGNPIKK